MCMFCLCWRERERRCCIGLVLVVVVKLVNGDGISMVVCLWFESRLFRSVLLLFFSQSVVTFYIS